MPFADCACFVFATTGYLEERAATAREAFTNFSAGYDYSCMEEDDILSARVGNIVRHVRGATPGVANTATACVIYGGFFKDTDVTPAHMWIEVNGTVYDTMPNINLNRAVANDENRAQGVAGEPYAGGVGSFATVLTTWQANNIADALLVIP